MSSHPPEQGPPTDPALSRLLRQWEVPSTPPPGFERAVWRRIDQTPRLADTRRTQGAWTQLMTLLRQPRTVAAWLVLVVGLGAGAGVLKGQAQAEKLSVALQGRYVQSIDPFSDGLR